MSKAKMGHEETPSIPQQSTIESRPQDVTKDTKGSHNLSRTRGKHRHLHDLHCHLDLYPDYQQVMEECEKFGIYTIAVTNTPSVFPHCQKLTENKRFVRPALGLHPELALARQRELVLFREYVQKTRYIGEVGLDFAIQDEEARQAQHHVFETILGIAADAGKHVFTVHSRGAAGQVVDTIGADFPGTIILHWYTGSAKVLARALAYGFFFSVNTAMLASQSGRRLLQQLPMERVLMETDGPFVKLGNQTARPRDTERVIEGLAALWKIEPTAVEDRMHDNLTAVLQA